MRIQPHFCVAGLTVLFQAGCGSQSFVAGTGSGSDELLAVKVADYAGANALSAKADAVTEKADSVSLPVELTQEAAGQAVIALTPADIVVGLGGHGAKVRGRAVKAKPAHASVVFRLAKHQEDACTSDIAVGPFELTVEDGAVSVDPTELRIPVEALALFHDGRLAMCVKTQADFDGTISLGEVAFETGGLDGDEERVTLCHIPPVGDNDGHTITVGASAVDAHLAHGDQPGECEGRGGHHGGDRDTERDGDGSNDLQSEGDGTGHESQADDGNHGGEGQAEDPDRVDVNAERRSADGGGEGSGSEGRDDDGLAADEDDSLVVVGDHARSNDVDNSGSLHAAADHIRANDTSSNNAVTAAVDAIGADVVGDNELLSVVVDGHRANDAADNAVDDGEDAHDSDGEDAHDSDGDPAMDSDDDEGERDVAGGDADGDGVSGSADVCPGTSVGQAVDAFGCSCSQRDTDGDGVNDCTDGCSQTPAGEAVDANGCSTSQLTATVTVPGPTDIYLAGQPDGTTATWTLPSFAVWTSNAPQHSPVMIDISSWVGKELRFTATGVVVTGGNNAASPDGRNWVLRPNGLRQVFGLTAMMGYKHGALVGVFLTDAPPRSGLLPYMSTSGNTTTTPLLQQVFVIGSSRQVVIPAGATRLFFGVAEQQGLVTDNSGSFDVSVEAVPHALLPSDPLAATRFYVGDPNDAKDGIGWFDAGQWAFDYDFDGIADFTTTFGQAGDQPVVGDWNGDGLDEIGVMAASASGNIWALDMNGNGVFDAGDASFTYGAGAGAIAIAGDWDGDGVFELGFVTPDNLWHLDLSGDRMDDVGESLNTQYDATAPVVGDWTGDGVSNLGNSTIGSFGWRFDLNNDRRWVWGTTFPDQNWAWGDRNLDIGVAGDWDGDGLDDPTRYRVSTGDWHFTTRVGQGVLVAPSVIGFGANATPVAGSWATVRAAQ